MLKLVTSRLVAWSALAIGSVLLVSCGSGSPASISSQPIPNIAGAWEFIALSNSGTVTGIEVALTEGSMLVNGVQQPDGAISASSDQIAFVNIDPNTSHATGFGGNCLPATTASGVGPGTLTALNAPISFAFTENGSVFNVTGTLSGDGKSILSGTYSAQSGNSCADSGGTITGTAVPRLAGIYTGSICPPSSSSSCTSSSDFTDSATATLSENSSSVLTLTFVLTGQDNTSFTLSGPVTGNAFSIQGTFGGQTLTYYGYSEAVSNAGALYLENVTNSTQPNYVGTLSIP